MKWLHKLCDGQVPVALGFVARGMALMVVVVFAQVVARLTAGSITWSEELARYIMIYLTYVGASVGVKRKSHIAIEFINGRIPRRAEDTVDIVANLLCLFSCAIMFRYGIRLVDLTMAQKTPAMQIPMGVAYFSMVLGSLLMVIHFITNILDSILDLAKGEVAEG